MDNTPLKYTNIKRIYTKRILLVWICFVLVCISGLPAVAGAAGVSLFLAPSGGEHQVGTTFSVKVKVDSDGAPVNAAQAKISFPQAILKVKSISKTGSIFKLWPEEPVFSNSTGELSFKGGMPAPGFVGEGTIVTISFEGKKPGTAQVFLNDAAVLAADGRGTDILAFTQGATFSITKAPPEVVPEIIKVPAAPKISSLTHPDEAFWYSNPNPEFQWEISPDIIGLSYKLDQNPFSIPEVISEEIADSKEFKEAEDGIWYFHLRVKNQFGWSESSRYKVQIDTSPPRPFDIIIDNQGDPTNPRPFLYFETEDDLSGMSHYEMEVNEGNAFPLVLVQTNPFRLPHQPPGFYEILVRAVDQAGNVRESSAALNIESIPAPEISVYPKIYKPGEEIFYAEGTALPNLTVIIFLKKGEQLIKTWEVESDEAGNWLFTTDELLRSGVYSLSARSRDQRGAQSDSSPEYPVRVILAGFSIGPWIFTYRTLLLALIIFIVLIMGIVAYFIVSKAKKLKKETREAAESLKTSFEDLKREIEKKVEYLDFKPGLSQKEKKLRDELMDILEESEKNISKEIQDIVKELK